MAKKNMRNEFEFMASVLDALGVEYEEADIKVRERWRGKVLEGWGVSYIPDDVKQFERWRGKCIEGLSKGGGGNSWNTVYSDTIDPEGEVPPFSVDISLTLTAPDTIKVVYDNTEYVLPKQVYNEKIYYGATPASLPADIDFSNCPFLIQVLPNSIRVYTETAGLHGLVISVPKSGSGGFDPSNYEILEFTEDPTVTTGRYICEKTFKEIYDDTNTNYAIYLDTEKFDKLYETQFVKGGYYTLACKSAENVGTTESPVLEYSLTFNLVGYGGEKSLQAVMLHDVGTESEYFVIGNIVH